MSRYQVRLSRPAPNEQDHLNVTDQRQSHRANGAQTKIRPVPAGLSNPVNV